MHRLPTSRRAPLALLTPAALALVPQQQPATTFAAAPAVAVLDRLNTSPVETESKQQARLRLRRSSIGPASGDRAAGWLKRRAAGGPRLFRRTTGTGTGTYGPTEMSPYVGIVSSVMSVGYTGLWGAAYNKDARRAAQESLHKGVEKMHEAGKPSATQSMLHSVTGGLVGTKENSSKYKYMQNHPSKLCWVVCGGKKTHDLKDCSQKAQAEALAVANGGGAQRVHRRGLLDKIKSANNRRKGYTGDDKSIRHVHVTGVGPADSQRKWALKKVDKQVDRGGCAIVHNKA
ncbi:hypothetical protein HK405_004381 [Cladochytrium tenue]|nr:hypothetical protein HK405_004381 [Cladochytrium tenue]